MSNYVTKTNQVIKINRTHLTSLYIENFKVFVKQFIILNYISTSITTIAKNSMHRERGGEVQLHYIAVMLITASVSINPHAIAK